MTQQKNYTQFTPGAFVRAEGYRMALRIIDGPNKKGQFLLALGEMKVWVDGNKLKLTKAPTKKPTVKRGSPQHHTRSNIGPSQISIDLHGFTVLQATEALEQAIDRALLNGAAQIEIVHGIGSGAVKKAVHEYLARSAHIKHFRIDEKNPGTTRVYL